MRRTGKKTGKRNGWFLAGLLAAAFAGGGAGAQFRPEPSPVEENVDKEAMHEGMEIRIIGMEEGDNHFRDGTPALLNSDRKPALVDTDRLYDRKRAMYEEGVLFHNPLPPVGKAEVSLPPAALPPASPRREGSGWTSGWLKLLVLLGGAGALLAAWKMPYLKK